MTDLWMIDELAHAGAEHLDPAFVAGYDRKQGYPDPAEDLAAFEEHGQHRRRDFDRGHVPEPPGRGKQGASPGRMGT